MFKNGTEKGEHMYSRISNPNRDAFESAVAACEGAKHAVAFSSGMAASAAVLHLLESGDHIAKIDDMYSATKIYIQDDLPRVGITSTSFSDMTDLQAAITPKTKLVWLESPTNPMLKVTDIAAVSKTAKENGCMLVVDNTFMSPALQRPIGLGADMSLNSVSKYINGHSDVVMGVVTTDDGEIAGKLRYRQMQMGAAPSPFDCSQASRGLRTLALRMDAHCRNGAAVANFLEGHAGVRRVIYPGLKSHPQHLLSAKQASGFGGMVTFYVHGGMGAARAFLRACRLAVPAVSLGGVETLVEHPASMTHAGLSQADREAVGISDELIRLSVGIEHRGDIVADLAQALGKAKGAMKNGTGKMNGGS